MVRAKNAIRLSFRWAHATITYEGIEDLILQGENMLINKIACTSCGAPISVPSDNDYITCTYCNASLHIQRGDGYVALKLAESVGEKIQEVGGQTQSTIREGTQITRVELRRLQLSQEISSLQIQLSNLQSEIRTLQRQKSTHKARRQLKELQHQEKDLISRINELQVKLSLPTTKHQNEVDSVNVVWSVVAIIGLVLGCSIIGKIMTSDNLTISQCLVLLLIII